MTKKLLWEALMFSAPIAFLTMGLATSHTGTDLTIIGATLYLVNQLHKLREDIYNMTED